MQRRVDALEWVVEQDWADPGIDHVPLGLVEVRGAEEGLVLLDRLALIVENGAAGAAPAGLGFGIYELALCISL